MNTKNYKKVENLFEGASKNVKYSRSLIEKPCVIEEFGDKIFIREQVMMTLDDGIEVERCFWSEADLSLCDISINKDMFDKSGNEDYMKYLESKGIYHEKHENNTPPKYKYTAIIRTFAFYSRLYGARSR